MSDSETFGRKGGGRRREGRETNKRLGRRCGGLSPACRARATSNRRDKTEAPNRRCEERAAATNDARVGGEDDEPPRSRAVVKARSKGEGGSGEQASSASVEEGADGGTKKAAKSSRGDEL